jgi:hypothetical protein
MKRRTPDREELKTREAWVGGKLVKPPKTGFPS